MHMIRSLFSTSRCIDGTHSISLFLRLMVHVELCRIMNILKIILMAIWAVFKLSGIISLFLSQERSELILSVYRHTKKRRNTWVRLIKHNPLVITLHFVSQSVHRFELQKKIQPHPALTLPKWWLLTKGFYISYRKFAPHFAFFIKSHFSKQRAYRRDLHKKNQLRLALIPLRWWLRKKGSYISYRKSPLWICFWASTICLKKKTESSRRPFLV